MFITHLAAAAVLMAGAIAAPPIDTEQLAVPSAFPSAVDSNSALSSVDGARGVSPAGCGGTTDYAHKSGSDASVHGRTSCKRSVTKVGVTTILQKKGWISWDSMKVDSSSRTGTKNSQDAHPHWRCAGWGAQTYRGYSSHFSVEGGKTYTTATRSPDQRFGC